MESLLGTFSVSGPGLSSGEAGDTRMDKVPDLRVLGEKRQGKKTAAWGSTDSDKAWEVSATGPVTVSVGENSPLFWPRSSEPTRAINPCRSGLQHLPAMSALGSVPGCQD